LISKGVNKLPHAMRPFFTPHDLWNMDTPITNRCIRNIGRHCAHWCF